MHFERKRYYRERQNEKNEREKKNKIRLAKAIECLHLCNGVIVAIHLDYSMHSLMLYTFCIILVNYELL